MQTKKRSVSNRGNPMNSRMKKLLVPVLLLGVMACNDTNAPLMDLDDAPESSQRMTLNHLRWDMSNGAPSFSAKAFSDVGEVPLAENEYGALLDDGVGGGDYTVSFWAVRGQRRYVRIEYEDIDEDTFDDMEHEFLRLEVFDPVAYADGTPIAMGEYVLITVTIDSETLAVELQPSGIQFGAEKTRLRMSYSHADPDMDNDGDVDADDAYIENNLLDLWVQEDPNSPWGLVTASQSVDSERFIGILEHFSEYAISW